MSAAAPSIRSSRRGAIRAAPASACISSTASSPIGWAADSIWIPSPARARGSRLSCPSWRHWSRRPNRPLMSLRGASLIGVGEEEQRRLENLAGLADQRGAVHDCGIVGVGAGNADANRTRAAEQRVGIRATGMALDQHLALEGIAGFDGIAADVKQVSVAAEDFAIPEHDNAAALARTSILQGDVDRIQTVFHSVPITPLSRRSSSQLCRSGAQRQRVRLTAALAWRASRRAPLPYDGKMTTGKNDDDPYDRWYLAARLRGLMAARTGWRPLHILLVALEQFDRNALRPADEADADARPDRGGLLGELHALGFDLGGHRVDILNRQSEMIEPLVGRHRRGVDAVARRDRRDEHIGAAELHVDAPGAADDDAAQDFLQPGGGRLRVRTAQMNVIPGH